MAKRKTAAEKRLEAEEQARLDAEQEAEKNAEEEQAHIEAEKKNAEEQARLDAEKKNAEEQARLDAEKKNAEEQARLDAVKTIDAKNPAYANKVINDAKSVNKLIEGLENTLLSGDASALKRIIDTYRTKRSDTFKKDIVNNNYSLYRLVNSILEETEYELFVLRFKFINKAFLLEKGDVFNSLFLSRYDYLWTWSTKTHKVYHMMVELISETCDPMKRKENLKVIDIENHSQELSNLGRQNLLRFYK